MVSGTWDSCRPFLLGNTEAKKAFSALSFSQAYETMSPVSFSRGPAFSLVKDVLVEAILFVHDIPDQTHFYLSFSFPNFTPRCSDNISVFLPGYPSFLCTCPFCVLVWPVAPWSSTQAFWHFYLTTSLLGCTSLELGGGDPWIITSFSGPLFCAGFYLTELYLADPWRSQTLLSFSCSPPLLFL